MLVVRWRLNIACGIPYLPSLTAQSNFAVEKMPATRQLDRRSRPGCPQLRRRRWTAGPPRCCQTQYQHRLQKRVAIGVCRRCLRQCSGSRFSSPHAKPREHGAQRICVHVFFATVLINMAGKVCHMISACCYVGSVPNCGFLRGCQISIGTRPTLSLQHTVHASRPPAAHLRIPEIVHAGVWHSFSALESKHPLPRLGRLEEKGVRGLLKKYNPHVNHSCLVKKTEGIRNCRVREPTCSRDLTSWKRQSLPGPKIRLRKLSYCSSVGRHTRRRKQLISFSSSLRWLVQFFYALLR